MTRHSFGPDEYRYGADAEFNDARLDELRAESPGGEVWVCDETWRGTDRDMRHTQPVPLAAEVATAILVTAYTSFRGRPLFPTTVVTTVADHIEQYVLARSIKEPHDAAAALLEHPHMQRPIYSSFCQECWSW